MALSLSTKEERGTYGNLDFELAESLEHYLSRDEYLVGLVFYGIGL